jgi:hypothetical protein
LLAGEENDEIGALTVRLVAVAVRDLGLLALESVCIAVLACRSLLAEQWQA